MLQINGKTFMNLQEAVQWLLDNNALPFQSTANYAGNTEIGIGTIVNPSPAKVRIGSLIFFADSKVSTVIGLTENGFICSDQYNSLVDDIVYVSDVAINASGHLITTLSNGDTIDAGLIKQVSSFSINASQHLIANYNDGTSTDLGAIFSGNVTISGYFEQGTANYSGAVNIDLHPIFTGCTLTKLYCRAQKINQKLSIVVNFSITNNTGADITTNTPKTRLVSMYNSLPADIANKIYDMLGHTVAEISSPDQVLIASAKASCYDGYLANSPTIPANFELVLTNREYANVYDVNFVSGQTLFTLPNGKTYYFTGRITLDLL